MTRCVAGGDLDDDPTVDLHVPSMRRSLTWLRGADDPTAAMWLAIEVDGRDPTSRGALVREIVGSRRVRDLLSAQRADGSWGSDRSGRRQRVLSTLHTLQTLVALGVGAHEATKRAAGFLADVAHVGGVFSIDGRHDGVLSCYVGTAASTYLGCGADGLAEPQIEWMLDHQDVARGGRRLRPDAPRLWGDYLRTRYGGCMADTTCLIGLARIGHALGAWAETQGDRRVEPLRAAIRDALLDRRLMFDSGNRILPLGVAPSKRNDWLAPTFPLDWRVDLIEMLDVVARSGPPDPRMQPAVDALVGWRLDDGSWPLRRSFWPADVGVRDRRSLTSGHPLATLRATAALLACSDGGR